MNKLILLILFFSCQHKMIHPQKGEIIEAVYGLGIIQSENVYNARAAILSSIKEFYVSEGDDVIKGQKLFLTDQSSLIKAPFAGRITEKAVPVIETLFPQTLILQLIDLDHLYLEVSLEQQGAMKLKKGMKAEISFEFFRNKKIVGKISTIYPKNDQFIAKVLIDDWPPGVLPGMSADVAFEVAKHKDATLVPIKSIANGHILIKRKEKKRKIPVQIGLTDQDMAEILSPELFVEDEIIIP